MKSVGGGGTGSEAQGGGSLQGTELSAEDPGRQNCLGCIPPQDTCRSATPTP